MTRYYKPRERVDVLDRIMARVEHDGDCWIFTGSLHPQGYGQIYNPGGSRLTHVIVYERLVGPVPSGRELDHLCRREACCNPEHLEPVTHRENVCRGLQPLLAGRFNAAKTHCRKGHLYNEANTHVRASGHRQCRVCDREAHAARRLAVS